MHFYIRIIPDKECFLQFDRRHKARTAKTGRKRNSPENETQRNIRFVLSSRAHAAYAVGLRAKERICSLKRKKGGKRMPETMKMSSHFQMKCRQSNGNLHIRTRGVFDGNSAHKLLNLLQEQYPGTGRVFVDTADLDEVLPLGCSLFRARLHATSVPAAQLFFKGEKGLHIAPDGSKVLIVGAGEKTNGCCGKCAACACGGKRRH